MNYILRTFFYSLALTLLLCAWGLNPETAQFKDLLAVLHWPNFWNIVGLIAITIAGADLAFSNKLGTAVDVVFGTVKRFRNESQNKITN